MIQINDEVNNLRELLKDNKTCIEYFAINKIKYNPEKKHKSLSPKMKLRKIYPLKLVLNKDQSRTRKQKIVRVIRVKVILKDNLGALH